MADVFISYAREDQPFAKDLARALEERGKQVWGDWDMPLGTDWRDEARVGIEASDSVVFVITRHSVESENCLYELRHARAHSKRIITLRKEPLEAEELPPSVSPITWIDFADGTGDATGWQRVVEAVDRDPVWVGGHTRWLQEALDWDRSGRDKSFLASGTELNEAEAWLTQAEAGEKEPAATPLHYEYILAGRRLSTQRQRGLFLAVSMALAVALALGANWLLQRNEAREQRRIAISRLLASEALAEMNRRLDRGLLLSAAAWSAERTPEARDSVLAGLRRSARVLGFLDADAGTASAVAFDPGSGGRVLASGSEDGRVRIWRLPGSKGQVFGPPGVGVRSVSISADGHLLGSVDSGGRAVVRDLRATSRTTSPLPRSAQVTALAFSPRGIVLALGTRDGAIALWQPGRAPTFVRHRRRAAITALSFSADGTRLAAGADVGVLLLEIRDGRAIGNFRVVGTDVAVADVALAPSGRRVAAALVSKRVVIATIGSTQPVARPLPEATNVASVAVGRLGNLVTGGADGSITLWNQRWDSARATLRGHGKEVSDLAFDRAGTTIASASADGMVVVWTLGKTPIQQMMRLETRDGRLSGLSDVAFLPGAIVASDVDRIVVAPLSGDDPYDVRGQPGGLIRLGVALRPPRLAAGGQRGVVLWRSEGKRLHRLALRGSRIGSARALAFSEDGSAVAAGTPRGSVHLWNLGDDKAPRAFPAPGRRPAFLDTSPVAALAVSVGAGLVALGNENGVVALWDVERNTARRVRPPGTPITTAAFSPDGRLLAFGGDGETIVVWNVETWTAEARITVHAAAVRDIAFSPDGRVLVSGDENGTINFWDVRERRNIGPPLEVREGSIEALHFRADGAALAAGASSGTVMVWTARAWDTDAASAHICSLVSLTEEEQKRLVPEGVAATPCARRGPF